MDEDTALHRRTYDAIARTYDERLPPVLSNVLAEAFELLCDAVPPRGRVVDLGCGPGREVAALAARGLRAVGVDLSLGMLDRARLRAPGRLVAGDLRGLPLRDGCLDGAWSSYALLHLSDADLAVALAEVARVLRPGGTAMLVLASQGGGEERVAYSPDHTRRFFVRDQDVVTALCRRAGMTVLRARTDDQGWRGPVSVLAQRG